MRADRIGEPGEKVIAYIDHIGRVEGVVTRTLDDGFAMTVIASERKKDKLAAQLTWLANKHELDLPEDRRHERVAPRNPMSVLKLTDGRQYQCRIIDLSLSGAAIEIDVKPALGVQVTLGTMRGQVVRHFEDGVAIEFAVVQRPETLDSEFNAAGAPDAGTALPQISIDDAVRQAGGIFACADLTLANAPAPLGRMHARRPTGHRRAAARPHPRPIGDARRTSPACISVKFYANLILISSQLSSIYSYLTQI